MGMMCRARRVAGYEIKERATAEKRLVYNMRPEVSQETGRPGITAVDFPQLIDFKSVLSLARLTLFETGTYTDPMRALRVSASVAAIFVLAIARTIGLPYQA